MPSKLEKLGPWMKAGIIFGLFVVAVLLATGVAFIHAIATAGPDRDTYGGMYAFGDFLLFLAALGFFSMGPVVLTIFLFRSSPRFWGAMAILALVCAGISILCAVSFASLVNSIWSFIAVPVILVSPFFFAGFGVGMYFAPWHWSKGVLALAAVCEAGIAIYGFLLWFAPML